MALDKPSKTSEDYKMLETFEDESSKIVRDLIDKFHLSIDKTNEHITDVSDIKTDITKLNTKKGINEVMGSDIKQVENNDIALTIVAGKTLGTYSVRLSFKLVIGKGAKQVTETHFIDLPLTKTK